MNGNVIVGQSGGPTSVINSSLVGVFQGAKRAGCGKIYGMRNGLEGLLQERYVELNDCIKNDLDIEILKRTPSSFLGTCRYKLPHYEKDSAVYEKLFAILKKLDIKHFFYIGGNDSMDTIKKLAEYANKINSDITFMGVPKTIDNDVMGTDHTPGYGSAAKYIAASMEEIIRDCAVYTVKAVTIVEIMGRDAGWLAASAALTRVAGVEPDLVYLPERVFDYEEFFADVSAALERHPNVVVAVSEGIRLADGTYVGESAQSGVADAFGHKYLSGTGKALEIAVKERLGCKVRSVELNILQRCASHIASKTDIDESVSVGRAAVEAAVSGVSGKMMTIKRVSSEPYASEPGYEDIEKIANMVRTVPDSFINERGNGITDEGVKYILPLIIGESYPEYRDGLPVHISLK